MATVYFSLLSKKKCRVWSKSVQLFWNNGLRNLALCLRHYIGKTTFYAFTTDVPFDLVEFIFYRVVVFWGYYFIRWIQGTHLAISRVLINDLKRFMHRLKVSV
ncbi:hypothetical protein Tsp_05488 [Trichinella spiralis]|uniref:hypothetical protein n=1 Tax=Trichinella spiralis TaxID=6334 RepID=UPI0001EFD99F|nr:hypothetical protein Tsp_05488 [Trichinella spiralis]